MIYYIGWAILMGLTLFFSIAGFFWAVKNGQFEDQKRLSYLPLIDLPPASTSHRPAGRTTELYVMGLCAVLMIAAVIVTILLGWRLIG